MRLSPRLTIALAANVLVALVISFIASRVARALEMREVAGWALAMLVMVPIVLWSARATAANVTRALTSLDDGLRAFRDGDFSMRLAARDGDEVSAVKRLYNEIADVLRAQRTDVYQKELLLDTILQRTPMAVVLVDAGDRVAYSNAAARELLASGARLDGHRFTGIVEQLAGPIRDALLAGTDAIVVVPTLDHERRSQDETFHVTQRTFRLNTLEHRLVLVERLTSELRRQEVAVWKKAIRVINHELNNTIAPISSLFHSAKLAQASPDRRHRLEEIYETIEERLAFLRTFLESYAQFARLPPPKREWTRWDEILADVHALYEFRAEGNDGQDVFADRAQLQQVLINLVKNAHEAGGDPESIVIAIQRVADGTLVRVRDRGRGMSEDVMRQALVPFFTTKPAGSGLGLPLCNEIVEAHGGRMRLESGVDGTIVTVWLPLPD
jgi:nitrogen fixation/metabolism regulation signal transduction histidine kinase